MIELSKSEKRRAIRMAKSISIDGITRALITRRDVNLFNEIRNAVVDAIDEKSRK